MNRFLSILFLLFLTSASFARPVNGVVCSSDKKLQDVVVTDGFSFTKTDEQGRFSIDIADSADFVYITTPSGFAARRVNGVTKFFCKVSEIKGDVCFDLQVLPKSDESILLAVGDPQTKTLQQFSLFENSVLPDLKNTIDSYAKLNIPTVTLYLGDVVWDNMLLFNNHKNAMAKLDSPVYAAIGNHDHQKELKGDRICRTAFGDCFGPTYYGFNYGGSYFIVLDNIIYDTNKNYIEDIDQQQINWLEKYLKFIPENSNVYIVMHAPVNRFWVNNFQLAPGHKRVIDMFSNYKLSFITGHTHINSNFDVLPGVKEHNVASACGAFWIIPYAPDGTPSGYQIFDLKNNNSEWFFKCVGKGTDFQMELYKRGSFPDKKESVVAKIWNWDPNWKVEWFEDGKPMGCMNRFNSIDPQYRDFMFNKVKEGVITQKDFEKANYLKPRESFFYFSAVPSKEAKSILVVATDSFGKKFSDKINL